MKPAVTVAIAMLAFVLGAVVMRVASSHRPPPALAITIGAPSVQNAISISAKQIGDQDYAGAISTIEGGLALQPTNADLRLNYAIAKLLTGKLVEGRAILQGVVRDTPSNELAHNNLAWADQLVAAQIAQLWDRASGQVATRDHVSAVASYKELLPLQPDNGALLNNLGVEEMALGQFELGRARFARAVELAPAEQLYRNNLAWAEVELARARTGSATPAPSSVH